MQPEQKEPQVAVPEKKKRKKIGWIIGVIALIVVLLAVGFVLWSRGILPLKPAQFADNPAKIEAADASVVTIFCYDFDGELAATGSGFVAFDGKTIITNYHVMTDAYSCKISTNQDISYKVAQILCYSKDQDIAILQLDEDTGLQPETLGDSSIIKKGETVVAIGSPLGIKNTVSTGVLSGRLMKSNMDVLQFTAPISSGSSGGALFDNNGNVIGITFASYVDGQNLNLAIPVELAIKLYDTRGAATTTSTIFAEEHTYTYFLEKYKDAPVVSVRDLKLSPQKYDGQVVKLSDYVSSCGSKRYDIFVSGKNDVSFNYEYDTYLEDNAGLDFEQSSIIHCTKSYLTAIYPDLPEVHINAGQKVLIWGSFSYDPKGESYEDPWGNTYVYEHSEGYFSGVYYVVPSN